jgi:hypothetical protein
MRRKWVVMACLLSLFAPVGCSTTEPTFYSWPHNKRRFRRIADGLHDMHMDIDRVIFDMETYPVEIDY